MHIRIPTHFRFLPVIVTVLTIICVGCSNSGPTLFEQVKPQQSGVHFANRIVESDSLNILDYEYIYNGGGVGVGDFNNDGLEDFFVTGNMADNGLFLNQGNLKFQDITESAGVASHGQWGSGIAVVDINTDGWDDIYVCNTTYKDPSRRKNNLYINQGLNTSGLPYFQDMAADYGLDDDTYSVNAAFFDYDNDNDLDVLIIINEMGDTRYHSQYRSAGQRTAFQRIDKLFRNDDGDNGHPLFTDVSAEANINKPGFSLGVNICDFNRDGWKDIYITNDFLSDDLLYINQRDGTFKDMADDLLKHTSHSAMGLDVADLNNDGYDDIVALDMLPENNQRQKRLLGPTNYTTYLNNERYGYSYQYVRNTLQLNNGFDSSGVVKFSDISLHAGIAATDWSWAPVIADFDYDGNRDLIVTNGFPKDVTDRDYMDYKSDSYRYASKEMMLAQIPSAKMPNYAFKNNGDLTFSDVSQSWGLDFKSYSNGAAYADLDNDGDLDLIINNINDSLTILNNRLLPKSQLSNYLEVDLKGPPDNPQGIGARLEIALPGKELVYEHTVYRGYLSSHSKRIHIGLGLVDTVLQVRVNWTDGSSTTVQDVVPNIKTTIDYANRVVTSEDPSRSLSESPWLQPDTRWSVAHTEDDFIDFNIQPLLPHKLSQYGPSLTVGDINGDKRDDIYIGGSTFHHGYFMIQQNDGTFLPDTLFANTDSTEELGTLIFDADMDGDNDLFITTGSYEFRMSDTLLRDRLFENMDGRLIPRPSALPDYLSNGLNVKGCDYDRDGDIDLFVGGRVKSGEFPKPVDSYLLENQSSTGNLKFIRSNAIPELKELGMVSDALWSDYNNDGWMDLLVVGEFMEITIFQNGQEGFSRVAPPSLVNKKGMWNSITGADIDHDGDMDYIVGNLGTNTFFKVSEKHPYRIYVNDFDNNGSSDAVPFAYVKDEKGTYREYPFSAKMDLVQEINQVRKMYPTYQAYSYIDRETMITDETLKQTEIYELNYPHSVLLRNMDGDLKPEVLPAQAQLSPVFGSLVLDVNGDGYEDILLVGNDYGNELIYGRMDALNGLVLSGGADGQFSVVPGRKSGFYVPGDGKSITWLKSEEGFSVITGVNRGPILKKDITKPTDFLELESDDVVVIFHSQSGSWKEEKTYGQSFLSQHSRFVRLPEGVLRLEVIKSNGQKRDIPSAQWQ